MCNEKFKNQKDKKADIDRFTLKYLGAACTSCYKAHQNDKFFIPLVFHNAKGYDLHHILKAFTKDDKHGCTFEGIPQNGEKLMSLTIKKEKQKSLRGNNLFHDKVYSEGFKQKEMCDVRIIDSLLFLLKSLEKLTDISKARHKDNYQDAFPITYRTFMETNRFAVQDPDIGENNGNIFFGFTKEQVDKILQKNLYPYLWFDNQYKFNLPFRELLELVETEQFQYFTDNPDDLVFQANFRKKKEVFRGIVDTLGADKLQKVINWTNIYLTCDVVTLADILESTRDLFIKSHGLDPMYYFGAPGYSWDAFLLQLTQEDKDHCPQLFHSGEMNMVCFFRQGIRGGCSGVMERFAQANNYLMGDLYDPSKPECFIIYLDANNLYGWAMKQNLPYGGFRWMTPEEKMWFREHGDKDSVLGKINEWKQKGKAAFMEVKLKVPADQHDKFNSFPPAPEKGYVHKGDVSPFTQEVNNLTGCKVNSSSPMLLQTLKDKDHYFVHSNTLALYIKLGLVVEEIYNAVVFDEAPIMRAYIEKNTKLRNAGTSDFEKELYKLLNNSIYGKTFEDLMKRVIALFVNGIDQYYRVVAKTGFVGAMFQQENFMIAKVLSLIHI